MHPQDVTEGEFSQLETRVSIAEREVEGEKLVTRHILEQTRRNGDDLATIKARLERVEMRLERIEHKLDGLDGLARTVGGLESRLESLTKSLPRLVGEAVREALRERPVR
jgi:hypothetical protein